MARAANDISLMKMDFMTNGLCNICNEQKYTNIHAFSECKHITTYLDGYIILDFKYENSRKMGIITNGLCNLCNEQNETNIHALSECKHIKTLLD